MKLIKTGIMMALLTCAALGEGESMARSADEHSFEIRVNDDPVGKRWLEEKMIFGSKCEISLAEIEGRSALKISTEEEFSDAFFDLKKLFGKPLDLTQSRYLSLKILIPKESWISALKLNFKDAAGNLGGIPEVTNNFHLHKGKWIDVVVDLQDLLPKFQMGHGDKSPLENVTLFSLNPYNAHQADPSIYYVSELRLEATRPPLDEITALTPRIASEGSNIPFKITFDDDAWLAQVNGYRAFDTTYQAFAKGIAGNDSRAIRMKGKAGNTHLAFLPALDKITGGPVDFTKVKKLTFSYHLTEESDDFDGSWLYLVTRHWKEVIVCKDFYCDYQKGGWHRVEVDVSSLKFEKSKDGSPVLPTVYELRLGLNYFPDKKNIEMWIDDFGWE